MQKTRQTKEKETISMEEYLWRRKKIREREKNKGKPDKNKEKSPAWMLAGLYV